MKNVRAALALVALIATLAACRSHDRCAAYNQHQPIPSQECATGK
jgi:hypothetical protein